MVKFKSSCDDKLLQHMGGDHMVVAAAKVSALPVARRFALRTQATRKRMRSDQLSHEAPGTAPLLSTAQ